MAKLGKSSGFNVFEFPTNFLYISAYPPKEIRMHIPVCTLHNAQCHAYGYSKVGGWVVNSIPNSRLMIWNIVPDNSVTLRVAGLGHDHMHMMYILNFPFRGHFGERV